MQIGIVNPLEWIQVRAFARQDGTFMGMMWIASFACYIGEFYNSSLGMLALLLAIVSVVFLVLRLKKFRDKVINGGISFRKALWFGFFAFFYASLLFAITQYIYFQFIDKGFLVQHYNAMLATPEAKSLLAAYKMTSQMQEGINAFAILTPIEKVFNFLTMNITMGIILSFPIAAIMKKPKPYALKNQNENIISDNQEEE